MTRRHFQLSGTASFVMLLCAGIVLLLLPSAVTQRVNFLFAETFAPVMRLGRPPAGETVAAGDSDAYVPRRDYEGLWKDHQNLHAQLLELQNAYETLAQIRSGLPRFFSGMVVADVITGSGSVLHHELLINKGAADGLGPGSYVMSPEGNSIVGVVSQSSDLMARVRLLTDANQSIEVRIRRDGGPLDVAALMFGDGRGACTIAMVERQKDIRPGDAVFAAARPGLLEVPLIIGRVAEVRPDEESPLLWQIRVQPVEDARTLKTVAVIVADPLGSSRR